MFNSITAVQTINTFMSPGVAFPNPNSDSGDVAININTPLAPGRYYIQVDEGAAVGSVIGGLGSEAIEAFFWHFNVTGKGPFQSNRYLIFILFF